jgi:hypothetical protein
MRCEYFHYQNMTCVEKMKGFIFMPNIITPCSIS